MPNKKTALYLFLLVIFIAFPIDSIAQVLRIVKTDGTEMEIPLYRINYMTIVDMPDPDPDHDYVDLGLPSGTLWATCNIGARNPEEYGQYFAWGETETKDEYNWETYKWGDADKFLVNKYCTIEKYGMVDDPVPLTELLFEDDAAYVNWGRQWRMPSREEINELVDTRYTTTEWTTMNGVLGNKITSRSNNNSIFLPAGGYYRDETPVQVGESGWYWSRTLYPDIPFNAYELYFNISGNSFDFDGARDNGFSIRPVRVSQ